MQTAQAELFVNYIINDLGYTVTQLSGYSQSAYMLKIGAKYHLPTTVFNGWFLCDCLNKKERAYIQKYPEMFRNYRKTKDTVVKYLDGNNRAKIDGGGTIFWLEGSSHSLKDWEFDENGQLLFPQSNNTIVTMSSIMHQAALDRLKLSDVRKKFVASGGKLTANEKIYLDDSETLILLTTSLKINDTILADLKKTYVTAESQAEVLWQKADQAAQTIGAQLSSAEAATALEIGGVLKTTLIDQPAIEYEQQMKLVTK